MEKFRDQEKEYKQKKLTKSAMQNETERKGKFKFEGSDTSFDNYDEEENEGSAENAASEEGSVNGGDVPDLF